jgi:hypothetical protein
MLRTDTTTDGHRAKLNLPVRIIPGFGVCIFPECYFLKLPGYSVNKTGSHVAGAISDGKVILQGEALKYETPWLFYVKVGLNVENSTFKVVQEKSSITTSLPLLLPSPPTVLGVIPVTYVSSAADGENERVALLALGEPQVVYKFKPDLVGLIELHHRRNGHRNYADCALQLGVNVPSNLPPYISCMKCKSRRRPLTGSSGSHDAPRPGYAFAWDHGGPFAVKSLGGKT